jgi:hypothetical protein
MATIGSDGFWLESRRSRLGVFVWAHRGAAAIGAVKLAALAVTFAVLGCGKEQPPRGTIVFSRGVHDDLFETAPAAGRPPDCVSRFAPRHQRQRRDLRHGCRRVEHPPPDAK